MPDMPSAPASHPKAGRGETLQLRPCTDFLRSHWSGIIDYPPFLTRQAWADLIERQAAELERRRQRQQQIIDVHGCGSVEITNQRERAEKAETEVERLKAALTKQNDAVCQTLGKDLGYPWFADDQKNSPSATEEMGVMVGEHVAESFADEAAKEIRRLKVALANAHALRKRQSKKGARK